MAQPLIKFFRASAAPTEGLVQGAIWFNPSNNEIRVYNGTAWEKYSGLVKNVEYAEATKILTITPFEGTATTINLENFVKGYINALDYTDTAIAGQYVSQVTQTDGLIAVTRAQLPVVDVTAPDGTTIVNSTSKKAELSQVTATTINAAEGDCSDNKFATEAAVRKAINALDKSDTAVAGQYVSAVSETDGIITVTRADLPAESFTGVQVEGVDLKNVSGKVNWGLNYDSTKKEIQVIDRNNADAIVDKIDATAFIKDGMVDTASIVWCTIEDGKHVPHTTEVEDAIRCLQIVFNTDAGKEAIHIPLNELTDVYTGAKDEITVSADNVIGLATVTQTNNDKLTQELAHSTATDPDTFAAVTGVTVDTKGRVTGVEKTTFTMPKLDIVETSKEGSDDYVKVTVTTENGSVKSVAVDTDALTTKISGIEADLTEVAQVTAAALVDLDARLDDLEDNSYVSSVKASTTSAHVIVTPTTEASGAVELTVNVSEVDATDKETYKATGLATDAYVDEKIAGLSGAVLHGVTSEEKTIAVSERDAETGMQNIELCWSGWAE